MTSRDCAPCCCFLVGGAVTVCLSVRIVTDGRYTFQAGDAPGELLQVPEDGAGQVDMRVRLDPVLQADPEC